MFDVKKQCVTALDEWEVCSNIVLEIRCSDLARPSSYDCGGGGEVEGKGRVRNYFM